MSHQFDLKYFHESSENNDTQKLKDMIKELVNRPDNKDGKTALQKASDKATISYLVNIGANVNVQDPDQKTALHVAALRGRVEVVKCLIENGAMVDAKDKKGCTPLYLSIAKGHIEIAKCLIENGASIDTTDINGY